MSNFSPDTLRSAVTPKGGFALNNKYVIDFSPPVGGVPWDNTIVNRLRIMAETAAMPPKSLATSEKNIYGPVFQIPYRSTFVEVAINFILTDSMEEKKFFDSWQNFILDPVTGNLNYHSDYVCDLTISKFSTSAVDFNDPPTYKIKLIDAWPSIVGEVGLTFSGGENHVTLPVTFQYKKWISL